MLLIAFLHPYEDIKGDQDTDLKLKWHRWSTIHIFGVQSRQQCFYESFSSFTVMQQIFQC